MSANSEITNKFNLNDETANKKPCIYIVDDDQSMGEFIAYAAQETGYEVQILCSAQELQQKWNLTPPDVIILDIIMPSIDGVELLRWLAKRDCKIPVILMSGYDVRHIVSASNLASALGINIVATIQKPIKLATLEHLFTKLKHDISGNLLLAS